MASYDLVVVDDNVNSRISNVKGMKDTFQEAVATYCECLRIIIEEGLIDGEVSENLVTFYQSAITIKEEFGYLVDDYVEMSETFVSDVNNADRYLY